MTQQDYETLKRECWEEFCNKYCFSKQDLIGKSVFYGAFDCAYALRKEKDTITHEEIEKAAEKYDYQHTEKLIHDMHNDSTSWKPLQDGIYNAFLAGANFALGKKAASIGTINGDVVFNFK